MNLPVTGGIVVPIITPLDEAECVDEPAMRRAVNHLLAGGVHGIFAMGTTGEFATLAEEEWRRGIEIVIDEVGGRVPVLAGVSGAGTHVTVQHLREAQGMGADAAVAALPYYFRVGEEEMVSHYRQLADATSVPIYAYNTPLTKMTFTEQVVGELFALEPVVGLKDSSNNFTLFQKLVARFDSESFAIFQGNETMIGHSLFAGASGGVLGLGNVAPRLCVDLYEACKAREYERAYGLQRKLVSLHRISRISPSPLTAVKYATSLLGLGSDRATQPFKGLTPEQKGLVKSKLEELDLL
jgi:4-hydroxy-tetrahydrodipicolinate synthase